MAQDLELQDLGHKSYCLGLTLGLMQVTSHLGPQHPL